MVVCGEMSLSGFARGKEAARSAQRGVGRSPIWIQSRLNKKTWNEQRHLGLQVGRGHPSSAQDGSPSWRPRAQDAPQGLLAL